MIVSVTNLHLTCYFFNTVCKADKKSKCSSKLTCIQNKNYFFCPLSKVTEKWSRSSKLT